MSRAALFGVVALAAALTSAGCGSLLGSDSEKPSTSEVEQELSLNQAGATAIDCADQQGGWDYVCKFTDRVGRRMKIGLLLNEDGLERASAAVLVDAPLAAPRASGDQAFDSWIAQVNSLCKQNLAAIQAVPQPASPAEFEDYARELHRTGSRYYKALSALPPPPGPEDKRIFTELVEMLEQDDQATLALSKAIRRGDNQTVQRLLQEMGERQAQEDAGFNKLGGNCL